MTIEPQLPAHDAQVATPTVILAFVAWLSVFLFVRHKIGLWAFNHDPDLLQPILLCTGAFVLVCIFARPARRAGRVTLVLSALPLAGLAVTAVAMACCPGGHPPLAGLLWSFTALISIPLLVLVLVRLFNEARGGERLRFVVGDSLAVLFTYAFATALIPIPI
ncbi:MAG: hypothetical protein M3P06_06715 [Acidobacteriota bacterium]|nr:hypothetical protein [Acidobacteriota bacterium]